MHCHRNSIGSFVEEVYNRQRLHSALDYLSPEEYEATWPRLRQAVPPVSISNIQNCP